MTALEAATAALARRDRAAADLVGYLERKGFAHDDAEAAVERLRDAGYVNDARYAAERARVLADRGYGDEYIRFQLEKDGVPPEEVEGALAELEPERERARGVDARHLAAKGFSADAIESSRLQAGLE